MHLTIHKPAAATGCTPLTPATQEFYAKLAQGWRPGLPAHIDAETFAIDARVVKALVCPGCQRRRSMEPVPLKRGAKGYMVLAVCQTPGCGHSEEV